MSLYFVTMVIVVITSWSNFYSKSINAEAPNFIETKRHVNRPSRRRDHTNKCIEEFKPIPLNKTKYCLLGSSGGAVYVEAAVTLRTDITPNNVTYGCEVYLDSSNEKLGSTYITLIGGSRGNQLKHIIMRCDVTREDCSKGILKCEATLPITNIDVGHNVYYCEYKQGDDLCRSDEIYFYNVNAAQPISQNQTKYCLLGGSGGAVYVEAAVTMRTDITPNNVTYGCEVYLDNSYEKRGSTYITLIGGSRGDQLKHIVRCDFTREDWSKGMLKCEATLPMSDIHVGHNVYYCEYKQGDNLCRSDEIYFHKLIESGSYLPSSAAQTLLQKQAEGAAAVVDSSVQLYNKRYMQDGGRDVTALDALGRLPPHLEANAHLPQTSRHMIRMAEPSVKYVYEVGIQVGYHLKCKQRTRVELQTNLTPNQFVYSCHLLKWDHYSQGNTLKYDLTCELPSKKKITKLCYRSPWDSPEACVFTISVNDLEFGDNRCTCFVAPCTSPEQYLVKKYAPEYEKWQQEVKNNRTQKDAEEAQQKAAEDEKWREAQRLLNDKITALTQSLDSVEQATKTANDEVNKIKTYIKEINDTQIKKTEKAAKERAGKLKAEEDARQEAEELAKQRALNLTAETNARKNADLEVIRLTQNLTKITAAITKYTSLRAEKRKQQQAENDLYIKKIEQNVTQKAEKEKKKIEYEEPFRKKAENYTSILQAEIDRFLINKTLVEQQEAENEAREDAEYEKKRQNVEKIAKKKEDEWRIKLDAAQEAKEIAETELNNLKEEKASRQKAEVEANRLKAEEEARQKQLDYDKMLNAEKDARHKAEDKFNKLKKQEEAWQKKKDKARQIAEDAARQKAEDDARQKAQDKANRQKAKNESSFLRCLRYVLPWNTHPSEGAGVRLNGEKGNGFEGA